MTRNYENAGHDETPNGSRPRGVAMRWLRWLSHHVPGCVRSDRMRARSTLVGVWHGILRTSDMGLALFRRAEDQKAASLHYQAGVD